jgi:hypothetical protein
VLTKRSDLPYITIFAEKYIRTAVSNTNVVSIGRTIKLKNMLNDFEE